MDEPRRDDDQAEAEDDVVEDLDVPEESAENVKGGILGIKGESMDKPHTGTIGI